jgi:hypothetical protein
MVSRISDGVVGVKEYSSFRVFRKLLTSIFYGTLCELLSCLNSTVRPLRYKNITNKKEYQDYFSENWKNLIKNAQKHPNCLMFGVSTIQPNSTPVCFYINKADNRVEYYAPLSNRAWTATISANDDTPINYDALARALQDSPIVADLQGVELFPNCQTRWEDDRFSITGNGCNVSLTHFDRLTDVRVTNNVAEGCKRAVGFINRRIAGVPFTEAVRAEALSSFLPERPSSPVQSLLSRERLSTAFIQQMHHLIPENRRADAAIDHLFSAHKPAEGTSKIIVPVVLRSRMGRHHIVCLYVDRDGRTIDYYDSTGLSIQDNAQVSLVDEGGTLLEKINSLVERYFPGAGVEDPVTVNENVDVHQYDWHNCGVFVARFIQQRLAGSSMQEIRPLTSGCADGAYRVYLASLISGPSQWQDIGVLPEHEAPLPPARPPGLLLSPDDF